MNTIPNSQIKKILTESKTIAVVGISRNPFKISREIAGFLLERGYNVVGVNPNLDIKIDSIEVYPSLLKIPYKIDIVNVFRKSNDIPEIINDVLFVKPKVLWLQLGIRNDEAVEPVVREGITVIQDTCIKVMYNILM
ncbi:CoA-binding protein [Melioribacteraceae bacterium 4301-Me]|uniref:CoA-binding protein n=1 Tax=Pyranulibacter aquaticus TaxID=3163344 RepID=UPI003595D60A